MSHDELVNLPTYTPVQEIATGRVAIVMPRDGNNYLIWRDGSRSPDLEIYAGMRTVEGAPYPSLLCVVNHQQDSDCTVNHETLCCDVCGVDHSEPCPDCGGRGFHDLTCVQALIQAAAKPS